jgi:2-methylcitrate dehydratase PrpD
MDDVTRKLVEYVLTSKLDTIPQGVRHEAVRSLVNWTGVTIAGSRHETIETALAALKEFSGPAQATLFGREDRLDILHAALINGMASAVLDFDTTQYKHTNIHPSGPILPAMFAFAETRPTAGEDFLHAYLLGNEIECRLANVVFGANNPGWHITGAVGAIGAAAAVGRLMGLDAQQLTWAFGIAATQPGGLREMYGTMCKSFTPGRASQNGLTAALLAAKGFTSSDASIEAPLGLAKVMADITDLDGLTKGLGQEFEVTTNIHKPFACAIVLHPIVDGCVQLRRDHDLAPDAIASVALKVNPNVLLLAGRTDPKTGLEGKFSFGHATALALVHGKGGEPEFQDALISDPVLMDLRSRVTAEPDETIRKNEAYVTITLTDGVELSRHVEYALGCLENPMGDGDIEDKFRSLAQGVLADDQVEDVLGQCWSIASLDDVASLPRATVPKVTAGQ